MSGFSLTKASATVVAISIIGGGALALDKMHVSTVVYDKYVASQESADEKDYILRLKRDIRDIQKELMQNPNNQYLKDTLIDMTDELCIVRPADRLCSVPS